MCQNFECDLSRKFQCRNKRCIPLWQICNGQDDCGDGSDENNHTLCRRWPLPCLASQYKCANEQCIPMEKVCDHVDDCGDLSDEKGCHKGTCNKETKGGCQHNCTSIGTPSEGGYICVCPRGYHIPHNNTKHCEDIDECSTFGHNCSQVCVNMEATYVCSCRPGFEMFDERCVAKGTPPYILFANGPDIRSVDLSHQHQSSLVTGESRVQSLDFDPINGMS